MFDDILEALQAFARGETTKGGFSRLELLMARAQKDTDFDPASYDEILARFVSMDDANNEDFAMGIALIAKKAGFHGSLLRDALERKLFSTDDQISARSQFELASLYIACGGSFAPQQLMQLTVLRDCIPELWLDLALEAYPKDPSGLETAIVALISKAQNPLSWSSLKPRYLKLIEAVTNRKFNDFVLTIAKQLNSEDQQDFLLWVNNKRGSQLAVQNAVTLISQDDIDFLTDGPCLAQPVKIYQIAA